MEKIVIKLLENPDTPQLKMKYVGSFEYCTPRTGEDGKVLTGLDENAFEIIRMGDGKAKKERQSKIQKEREELEKLLGVDLTPSSDFWSDYVVALSDEETVIDPTNPKDRVKEKFLLANRYVAPSREAIELEEDYQHCIFYFWRQDEELTKKAEKQIKTDKATALLIALNEQPLKLKLVAIYLLGYGSQDEIKPTEAYVRLRDYLAKADGSDRTQKKNIDVFIDVASKSIEELTTKIILDKAIKKRIITGKNDIYRRGDVILGNSYEEALSYLTSPENSGELLSLQKEVNK